VVAAGAWLSVMAGAAACSVQLALSGTVPLDTVLPAMLGVHAVIGVGEAVISVAAVSAVIATRPDLIGGLDAPPQPAIVPTPVTR
jgi:cobalt/nickel transport system permease protein